MKNFHVLSVLCEEGHEVSNPDFRSFDQYADAVFYFYYLVGQYSSDYSKCSVESFDTDDSSYLKKIRVLCGNVRIYIYLQKNS